MNRKGFLIIGALLVVLVFGGTLAVYGELPARVPIHWNLQGQADGFGPRWHTLAVFPAVMLGLLGLTAALPWLSPRRFEVNGSNNAYLQIMLVVLVFLAYIHFVTLAAALGRAWNMNAMIMGAVCAMFVAMALPLSRVRRNFYVGVRTPWTLANERVWQATHRFAAKTFVAGGLAGLALAFLVRVPWAPIVAIVAAGLAPVIHSLVFYKQLERRGEV